MNHRLQKPITYLITEGDADPANFTRKKNEILQTVRLACEAGVSMIQIREKKLTGRLLLQLANAAVLITSKSDTMLLINGRADIVVAAGADGVHLPADGLSADVVRKRFPKLSIGVSTHSAEEASAAKRNGADLVTFGPVFLSLGKGKPQGIEELSRVCKLVEPFPVLALGGIDKSNYRTVLENGASGFAAIRFLNDETRLRKLLEDL